MGKIAHRNDLDHPAGCPSCDCPLEDKDHVILCPSPICCQWRSAFIDGLQQCHNSPSLSSNPILSDILQHSGLIWFRVNPYDPAITPSCYCKLVHNQNAIGWHQLFCRRLSLEWQSHQDIHLQIHTEPNPKKSGRQWAHSIATHFLQ
jgi:hypothetical protein